MAATGNGKQNILFLEEETKRREKDKGREKLVSFSPMAFTYTYSQVMRGALRFSENINRATHKDTNGGMKEK